MKPHYFNQEQADDDDLQLKMSVAQGYVPRTCLLGGPIVFGTVTKGEDPCKGCLGPREKCKGRHIKEATE